MPHCAATVRSDSPVRFPLPLSSFAPRLILVAGFAWLAASPAAAQTLEQMAGQMIVVGFTGDETDDAAVAAARSEIEAGLLGGVMYLKTNVKSLAAVRAMNAAFRAAAPTDLPPLITLDQEGGAVERLTADVGFEEIAGARAIAAAHRPDAAGKIYGELAQRLVKQGFTVNFGPVVDLDVNPQNQIIARFGRAFGASADDVAAYAGAFIAGHRGVGLLTALKHFPGHGSSTADSHEGFVDITGSWDRSELEPYRTLIAEGMVDMIMVGHLYHADYSGGDRRLPSSLSPDWIEGVLRDELGYSGVVISDDLEMGAIRSHFTLEETVKLAVRAGVDVLLFANTVKPRASLAGEIRAILVAEAERDAEFRGRVAESYARIVGLRERIGQSQHEIVAPVPAMRPPGR